MYVCLMMYVFYRFHFGDGAANRSTVSVFLHSRETSGKVRPVHVFCVCKPPPLIALVFCVCKTLSVLAFQRSLWASCLVVISGFTVSVFLHFKEAHTL